VPAVRESGSGASVNPPYDIDLSSLHSSLGDPIMSAMMFLNEVASRYPDSISFAAGRPAEDYFDTADISRFIDRFCDHLRLQHHLSEVEVRRTLLQYGRTNGIIHELIARQLENDEGVQVSPDSLVVTVGAQEAIFLVVRALCASPTDAVLTVSPTYVGLAGAARMIDCPVVPVPSDETGIDLVALARTVESSRRRGLRPRLLYVVPDVSNPTGISLDVPTRRRLVEFARVADLLIVEDNAYGVFAGGDRLPTLKSLDVHRRVIRIGSFAKTVWPGARIGFVVADQVVGDPTDPGRTMLLADQLGILKSMVTVNTSPIAQAVVGGALLEHDASLYAANARQIAIYQRNLRLVLDGLERRLGEMDGVSWNSPSGGFFVSLAVPFRADERVLERCAREYGVLWAPMANFYTDGGGLNHIRLAISQIDPPAIEEGLDRLARFVRDEAGRTRVSAGGYRPPPAGITRGNPRLKGDAMTTTSVVPGAFSPHQVRDTIARHMLADGYELVLDLEASRGSQLVDARTGETYLDFFSFFASCALGMNHPALADDEEFVAELGRVAVNKPSNTDIYSVPMARFVDAFARVLGDPALPHLFFVDGGALAVENALKVSFDWKSRWNEAHDIDARLGTKVLHLENAFHGRSGYTLSLTNTCDLNNVARFPKFDWPRIPSPSINGTVDVVAAERVALDAARVAFEQNPHDIACFVAEPIQGAGGDNHFRPGFFQGIQALCREFDALFVMDEVQTGVAMTGTAWAYQQLGVHPDVVAFGKKVQVCGIMAGGRVDEIADNVFNVSSRLCSTWGGNIADMVRARRILEVVETDGLIGRSADLGAHLLDGLRKLAARHDVVSDVRGRGLFCAFSLPTTHLRDLVLTRLREQERVIAPGSGPTTVQLRPALTVSVDELDTFLAAVDRVLSRLG
jgi:L-lysine 6-transaminase